MAPSQNTDDSGITRRQSLAAVVGVGTLAAAGCLGGGGAEGELSGTIDASGSNTVAPITSWAGENFQDAYPGVTVDVDPQGTGAGFQEFTRANSDIQSASRLITEEEIAIAEENDVEYSHYTVGLDGLAVVKNSANDWVDNITLDELKRIWEFESDVETWSDVRDEWPDEEIALHGRDSASGTFDYFTREITGGGEEIGNVRDDYSATSQTNEIMGAVADNEHGFGFGGVGYLRSIEDEQDIEAVPVESDVDGDFYLPIQENIESGIYSPLARPLFVYVNHATLAEEKTDLIGSFMRFYFNDQRDFARDEGFYATPQEQVEENHDEFEAVLDDLDVSLDEITVDRA